MLRNLGWRVILLILTFPPLWSFLCLFDPVAASPFHSVQASRSGQKKFLVALKRPGGMTGFTRIWRVFWCSFSGERTGLNSGFTSIFISRCGQADVLCQNCLGELIRYLNSQLHSGSTESEFIVLELKTFIETISSDDSPAHKISRSSSSFQISFL